MTSSNEKLSPAFSDAPSAEKRKGLMTIFLFFGVFGA